jgi:LuxR family quorum sensing-dependent transcriptional regulator
MRMLQDEFRHFDSVLASIDFFERSKSSSTLIDCVRTAAAAYGYNHFVIAAAPNFVRHDFDQLVLLRYWPEQWFKEYVHEKFHPHDPIAAHARSQCKAFAWADAPIRQDDGKATRLMDLASRDHGMRRGLCVPIHGMHGYEAAISFAGPEVDDTAKATAAMELVAICAMNQLMRLRSDETLTQPVLSAREKEVLTWAAVGKTAWDTGCILSISTDTVNKHMASAMRKLKAYTKTQAVAESIRRGEIQF